MSPARPAPPRLPLESSLQCAQVQAKLAYLEDLDGVLGSERLSLEAMRGQFVDQYAAAVAENVAAGLGPPTGKVPQPAAAPPAAGGGAAQ